MIRLVTPLLLMLLLAGCGKTGELYLPDVAAEPAQEKTPEQGSELNSEAPVRGSL